MHGKNTKGCVFLWIIVLFKDITAQEDYQTPRHYILNLTQTSWHDAVGICSQNGGTIATIYDYSTIPDLNLEDSVEDIGKVDIWIGLYKTDNQSWIWESGENVTNRNWDAGDSLSHGCAAVSTQQPYSWTSLSCTQRLPFLCQHKGGDCGFKVFKNASIAAHNYMYLYQKTVDECKNVCLTTDVFLCQSFEYERAANRCQFNSGNRWTLAPYYADHQGWDYYHRTCNSGDVTGFLLDLSTTSSEAIVITSTSGLIAPTSTVIPVTSTTDIQCSEILVTKDIFITKDVFQTHELMVSKNIYVTREIPITRELLVTKDVALSTTVTETATVTMTMTSTVTLTPSPVFFFPSESVYKDPVEELKELETEIKERAKTMKKISVMDDRPSATYVGYLAILFLSSVFCAILLFDLLTVFQSGMFKKCSKKFNGSKGMANSSSCPHIDGKLVSNESITYQKSGDTTGNEGLGSPSKSNRLLWRKSVWAVGDSGIGDSSSEVTCSESTSTGENIKENSEVIMIEFRDKFDNSTGSSPAASSCISTTGTTVSEQLGSDDDVSLANDVEDLGVVASRVPIWNTYDDLTNVSMDITTHL